MSSDHESSESLEGEGPEQADSEGATLGQNRNGPWQAKPARRQSSSNKYTCRVCSQSFKRREHLQRHEQSHGKEKPYTCRRCWSKFSRKDTMLRHARKFHPDQEPSPNSITDGDASSSNSLLRSLHPDNTEAPGYMLCGEHPDAIVVDSLPAESSRRPLSQVGQGSRLEEVHAHTIPQQIDDHSCMDASQDIRISDSGENIYGRTDPENTVDPLRTDTLQAPQQPDNHNPSLLPDQLLWFLDGEPSFFDTNDLALMLSPNMPLSTPGRDTPPTAPGMRSGGFFTPAPRLSQLAGISEDEQHLHATMATTDRLDNTANSPVLTDSEASACVETIKFLSSSMEGYLEKLPLSKSMICRYFEAYVRYFDPHTPIVHLATFKIVDAPASLTMAMLTLGALYASEPDRSSALYKMASECLEQSERQRAQLENHEQNLFGITEAAQSRVLLAQYALCSNDGVLVDSGLMHLLRAGSIFRSGIPSGCSRDEWTSWIHAESLRRAELWTLVLCAVFGADGQVAVHLPSLEDVHHVQLPCLQEIWTESTKNGWLAATASAAKSHPETLGSSLASLIQGRPLTEALSPFGTLVLIAGLLVYILTLERTTSLDSHNARAPWIPSAEKFLRSWEKVWKGHSYGAARPPNRKEPLLADCIPLFLTACYHTHASPLLKNLKASLALKVQPCARPLTPDAAPNGNQTREHRIPTVDSTISIEEWEQLLTPQSEAQWRDLSQAARLAAGYILVRAKQGFRNVARTAPLEMGFHNILCGFEGALLVSCWEFSASKEGRSDPNALLLHGIIRDIMEEMDGQMFHGLEVKQYPAIASLIGLQSMMSYGWVWSLAHGRAGQLRLHETRIIAALDQRRWINS